MYKVIIEYYRGKRKGLTEIIENVQLDEILYTFPRISKYQRSNADIWVERNSIMIMYNDFISAYYSGTKHLLH